MDSSLDSIWDEPVLDNDPPPKDKESLFLQDSDDEGDVVASQVQKPAVDIDMDALFAGVDDDDDDDDAFTFKPLAPSLDAEALRREAESRHKNRLPSLTPHPILPSSSPPRDTGNSVDTKDREDDKGKDRKKERRKPTRLDEGRLLGSTGFPQLIKDTKNFRTKGKGHEATDLNRLLQVYQFWTHGLYPKTQFRDTVERIEKLCHSKRMNVSLSVWRDEAHGRVNNDRDSEADEVIDLTEHEDTSNSPVGSKDHPAPSSDKADYAPSSLPPSNPPSSGPDSIDDDDFDLDEIFRAEDERRAKEKIKEEARTGATNNGSHGNEEAGIVTASSIYNDTSHQFTNTVTDDDQVMWDELDQIQGDRLSPVAPKDPLVRENMGDDDEMWDVIDELEGMNPAAVVATTASNSAVLVPDDYDIEDMYI